MLAQILPYSRLLGKRDTPLHPPKELFKLRSKSQTSTATQLHKENETRIKYYNQSDPRRKR
jgi:hypothetical protein